MSTSCWLIWDAASKDIIDKLLYKKKLPNLQKLLESGVGYRVKSKQLNCQTPCALAVQFTGKNAEKLGISGYNTPILKEDKIDLDYINSFNIKSISKSVLWDKSYIGDKKIALCQIPYCNIEQNDITLIECYEKHISDYKFYKESDFNWDIDKEDKVRKTTTLKVLDEVISLAIVKDSKKQFKITISNDIRENVLILNEENNYIDVCHWWIDSEIGVNIFLFKLDNDEIAILFTDIYKYKIEKLKDKQSFRNYVGIFQGKAYGRLYRKGLFGAAKYNGGKGRAEKIFLYMLEKMVKCFEDMNMYFLNDGSYDFVISYEPCIDEASHEFYGWYKNSKDKEEKEFYWSLLEYSYSLADRHLGKVLNMCENNNVFVSSDHGIYDVDKKFYINSWLKKMNLLSMNNNKIDLNNSKVFYHQCDNGALFFNENISEYEKENILKTLTELEIDGVKVVKSIVSNRGNKIFGDVYIIPADRIILDADFNSSMIEVTNKTGCHTTNVGYKSLDAIFYAAGKDFNEGIENKVIFNTDIKEMIKNCFMRN